MKIPKYAKKLYDKYDVQMGMSLEAFYKLLKEGELNDRRKIYLKKN